MSCGVRVDGLNEKKNEKRNLFIKFDFLIRFFFHSSTRRREIQMKKKESGAVKVT